MKPTAVNVFLLQQRVSQKQLAEALSLHRSTICLLLSGKLHLEGRLHEIAQYLKISRAKLDRLIAANGNKERKAE